MNSITQHEDNENQIEEVIREEQNVKKLSHQIKERMVKNQTKLEAKIRVEYYCKMNEKEEKKVWKSKAKANEEKQVKYDQVSSDEKKNGLKWNIVLNIHPSTWNVKPKKFRKQAGEMKWNHTQKKTYLEYEQNILKR